MERLYSHILLDHINNHQQMLFLSGPCQVGKTTISQTAEKLTDRYLYLNWDDHEHRDIILHGASAITEQLHLIQLSETQPIIVFDEIHKHPEWKNFLKGFYDRFGKKIHIIILTSSEFPLIRPSATFSPKRRRENEASLLNSGGDSLMGRYFSYRIHPLSVAEIARQPSLTHLISPPQKLDQDEFEQLFKFGGFPDPFLKHTPAFSTRWQRLRHQQLFREDIRDLSTIADISRLELLAKMIAHQPAAELNYSSYAKKIRASIDTIRRWISTLEAFYYCFSIRPWSQNITRSLIKEPRIFLHDWSIIQDPGARAENFIACHLLKATHFWTDMGFGDFDLHYLRDLEKREVDFLVTRDNKPWFLVEVKTSKSAGLSPHLQHFQQQIQAEHAFQVVIDAPYVNKNCFEHHEPIIVPAITFLSQLV